MGAGQVADEGLVVFIDGFFVEEVTNRIKDGTIEHAPPLLYSGVADGLVRLRVCRSSRVEVPVRAGLGSCNCTKLRSREGRWRASESE